MDKILVTIKVETLLYSRVQQNWTDPPPPVPKSSFATSDDCNSFHRGRIILKVYIFEKPLRRAFQKHIHLL